MFAQVWLHPSVKCGLSLLLVLAISPCSEGFPPGTPWPVFLHPEIPPRADVASSLNKYYNIKLSSENFTWNLSLKCWVSLSVIKEWMVAKDTLHHSTRLCTGTELKHWSCWSDVLGLHVIINISKMYSFGLFSFFKENNLNKQILLLKIQHMLSSQIKYVFCPQY